jgi:acyl-coenzyme A thioesterase PaaI-like protein
VAIGLSSQIVGNVQEGVLRAEATVVHGGRTLVVVETRVSNAEGRLLAIVNTTHFIRSDGPRRHGGHGDSSTVHHERIN